MKKYFYILTFLLAAIAIPARAQVTYTLPQTVQQTLAPAGTACTGAQQNFFVTNLGQTQHYASVTPAVGTTDLFMVLLGQDVSGNNFTISDAIWSGATFSFTPAVTGTGSYPKIFVQIVCHGGTFTLNYSGTSATSNLTTGSYLLGQVDKAISQSKAENASSLLSFFIPPFGNSLGTIAFQYNTASIAGSTVNIGCLASAVVASYVSYSFNVANTTTLQTFQVPQSNCAQISVTYSTGGGGAGTYSLDYLFTPPGTGGISTSGSTLGASLNVGAALAEKGSRWSQIATPAAGSVASASRVLGAAGVRHVADCVSYSAGAIAAPAATQLQISLRDGATGAGTVIWAAAISIPATTGNHYNQNFCGLNLIGTAATAMTLEFTAGLANESESVTLTGYDVQ